VKKEERQLKPFRETHAYPPSFPFVLLHKQQRRPETEVSDHFHDWYEIVYVHSGEGTFFIDRNFYSMRAQDVFIIPGDTIHRPTTVEEFPYTVSVILFSPSLVHQISVGEPVSYLDIFQQNRLSEDYRLSLTEDMGRRLEQSLQSIANELAECQSGYRLSILAMLHRVLIDLLRNQKTEKPMQMKKELKSIGWMKEILTYIDDHLDEDLSLSHLAGQALISSAHFSRVFKQMTGFHLPEYLNAKRMIKARQLLLETSHPISYIAFRCGYESVPHFHRIFKSHVGVTPGEYRSRSIEKGGL
jgi:AraC-like DNA-binding protein